jgi:hypothetical protein
VGFGFEPRAGHQAPLAQGIEQLPSKQQGDGFDSLTVHNAHGEASYHRLVGDLQRPRRGPRISDRQKGFTAPTARLKMSPADLG